MIKILYVITKSNWGGAQRYVYDIATSLDKEMFDAAVACGGNGLLATKLQEAGVRVIQIPFLQRDINIIKEFLSLFALFKIFRKERPDVIHLNSAKIGGLGAVAAYGLRIFCGWRPKVIFTAHGWGFNEDRPYLARVIIFLAQWISVIFCDFVICVSCAVFNQGMYFPFASKKLRLINLGIKSPDFLKHLEARHRLATLNKTNSLGKEFPSVWIGCIAELAKNKGLAYLIDAISILRTSDVQVLIIGDGEDYKKLQLQISNLQLQDKVFLLGFVPEASRYLKAFDMFVLPSITEAGAYVLHEAGFAGIPAVGTKVGGIPYIIKDGENGFLVPPKNPEKLAEALKKLLGDENLRKIMGQKNYDLVSQKFSFEKMLRETIDIYNKVS